MELIHGEIASRRRGKHGPSESKRAAADARAFALASTIQKAMAAGFVAQRPLAKELNRRGVLAPGGGKWHRTSIGRVLKRLDLITSGRGVAIKEAADSRARALAPIVRELRKAGVVSISAIAHELNLRRIPTAQGSKWHPFVVSRLLQRLDKLDRASRSRHRR